MRGIRLRYWLPVANLAIDAALLGMLAWSIHEFRRHERSSLEVTIRPVAFLQEGQAAVGWDIGYVSPPPLVRVITVGTLPAGVASLWAWDWHNTHRWVYVHEGLAAVFWFVIGWLAESPQRRKWVLRYLSLRALSVPASLSSIPMGFCALAMFLAWIAAGVWLLGWVLRSGVRMVRGPR